MIVARQFIAWKAYKNSRVPEGRLIGGGRQIEPNTSMNVTAFQPPSGTGRLFCGFPGISCLATIILSLLRDKSASLPGLNHDSARPSAFVRQPPDYGGQDVAARYSAVLDDKTRARNQI
jgi:hypothetical protein